MKTFVPSRPGLVGRHLVVLVLCLTPGCATLTVIDSSEDENRRRRAEATGTAVDLIAHQPAPGDTLDVRLADGQTLRGAFVGVTADTLRLARPDGAVALGLGEVEEVRRPWAKARYDLALLGGVALDLAFSMVRAG